MNKKFNSAFGFIYGTIIYHIKNNHISTVIHALFSVKQMCHKLSDNKGYW